MKYAYKAHIFGGEKSFELSQSKLTLNHLNNKIILLNDITKINLYKSPANDNQPAHYRCTIYTKTDSVLLISQSIVSVGNLIQHNESFLAFLLELHHNISKNNVQYTIGLSIKSFNFLKAVLYTIMTTLFVIGIINLINDNLVIGLVLIISGVTKMFISTLLLKSYTPKKYKPTTFIDSGILPE